MTHRLSKRTRFPECTVHNLIFNNLTEVHRNIRFRKQKLEFGYYYHVLYFIKKNSGLEPKTRIIRSGLGAA